MSYDEQHKNKVHKKYRKIFPGMVFGRLVVIWRDPESPQWVCRCICDRYIKTSAGFLNSGATASCGCSRRDKITHGASRRGCGSPEYNTWTAMKGRCLNPNNSCFEYYGGRGIVVCDRWMEFHNFLSDMGPKPSRNHTIDRVNVDGNYAPGNCRWASSKEQQRNKRNNRIIEFNGVAMTIAEWSEKTGIPYTTLCSRVANGWDAQKTLTPNNKALKL